ncbi:hypothetical protein DFH27DRAFT_538406 [Peziza echinospora]|nr:hypothetical protein DFH27DRAFT_538406 [Peziza echinospora]
MNWWGVTIARGEGGGGFLLAPLFFFLSHVTRYHVCVCIPPSLSRPGSTLTLSPSFDGPFLFAFVYIKKFVCDLRSSCYHYLSDLHIILLFPCLVSCHYTYIISV